MTISFGGLASGMDTDGIIDQLMSLERAPITRIQGDKTWMANRLAAFTEFDTKLQGFLSLVENTSDREQYFQRSATASSSDFFTSSVTNDALSGANYQIEVESLAQVQKSYSNTGGTGFTAKDTKIFGTGDLTFLVGTETKTVTIEEGENSLEGIMKAINDADIGISASILNDGTTDPYRLTFTADTVATSFSLTDSSELDGDIGVTALGQDGDFVISQEDKPATIKVDGISITSDSNTITEAIPGVTLNLLQAEIGTITQLDISSDNSAITRNIQGFVAGYNSAISFISSQSTIGGTSGGVLGGDSGLNSIKRHLQNMLTDRVGDSTSTYRSLSQLGLETQKDGTIKLNTETLDAAIENDINSVADLLAGKENDSGSGIATQFEDYLKSLTSTTTGLLAGRSQSINSNIKRMDDRILQMEMRLEKREATLRKQYYAMEEMVSLMNSTGDYLTTQMRSLENLWNYNR